MSDFEEDFEKEYHIRWYLLTSCYQIKLETYYCSTTMEFRDNVTNQLANQAVSKGPRAAATLTTSNGCPVATLTASQTAGPRGPITLQDFTLVDHLASFDREVSPICWMLKIKIKFIIVTAWNREFQSVLFMLEELEHLVSLKLLTPR